MKKRKNSAKKTKDRRYAKRIKRLVDTHRTDTEAVTDILDAALTSAETHLQKLLPGLGVAHIKAAFYGHIQTHLEDELGNIARHGHRNDDPGDIPDEPGDTLGPWGYELHLPKGSADGVYRVIDIGSDNQDVIAIVDPDDIQRTLGESAESIARLIAQAPTMQEFIALAARMKTESEFGDNAPASEDWISTLNDLIASARKILPGIRTAAEDDSLDEEN